MAIDARVSSEKQAEEGATSLDEQIRTCRRFAEGKGWEIVAVFREEGGTGTVDLDPRRPEWARVEAAARAGEFEIVLFAKWNRVARKTSTGLRMVEKLEEKLGISIAVAEMDIDTTTPTGRYMRTQMLAFAEMQHDDMLGTMANGAHGKARDGRWPSADRSAPFGYRVHREGTTPAEMRRSARLVPDERERETALTAARLILDEGWTNGRTADYLNAQGMTPRGSRVRQPDGEVVTVPNVWNGNTLRQMLERESLTGYVVWGGGRFASGKYGEPVVIPGVEPILPRERWLQVCQALRDRWTQHERPTFIYWLSGRVVPPTGCASYTGLYRARLDKRCYRCDGKNPPVGVPSCKDPWLDADWLEETVWQALCDHLGDASKLERAAREHLALVEGNAASQADELESLNVQIEQRRAALQANVTAYMRAGVDASVVAQAAKDEQDAISALEARRSDIARLSSDAKAQARAIDDVAKLAGHMAGRLPQLDDRGRALVAQVLDLEISLLVDPDELEAQRPGQKSQRPGLRIRSRQGAGALAGVLVDEVSPRGYTGWVNAPLAIEVAA